MTEKPQVPEEIQRIVDEMAADALTDAMQRWQDEQLYGFSVRGVDGKRVHPRDITPSQ